MFARTIFLSVYIFSLNLSINTCKAESLNENYFLEDNLETDSKVAKSFLKRWTLEERLRTDFSGDTEVSESEASFIVKSVFPFYLEEWLFKQNISSKSSESISQRASCPLPLSSQCCDQVYAWVQELGKIGSFPPVTDPRPGIFRVETWALQMVDAWGKIPEGFLSGHVNSFGDWDECRNLRGVIPGNGGINEDIRGKYCTAYLLPPTSPTNTTLNKAISLEELLIMMQDFNGGLMIPSIASCVPSACSVEDATLIMGDMLKSVSAFIEPVTVCEGLSPKDVPFDVADISMIALSSLLALILCIATIVDLILTISWKHENKDNRGIALRCLLAFSVYTNVRKWSNTTTTKDNLGCLHGLRFFSTAWVVLGHTWLIFSFQPTIWNFVDTKQVLDRHWSLYVILNATLSVDTFFVLSGLLSVYGIMKVLAKTNGRINVPMLYIHRYLRLTPTYALVIGFTATLLFYLSDGPYWPGFADSEGRLCRKFWWHNLLYINNLIEYDVYQEEALCIGESWYLSNDMQFFILAPLYAYLLWKWEMLGVGFLALSSVGSIVAPGIITYKYEMPPIFMPSLNHPDSVKTYYKPWTRIGPYLAGIWLAYILYKTTNKTVKIPKLLVLLGWLVSTAVALTLIFGIIPYYRQETDNRLGSAFYAAFSRFSWGLVIVWIIFACVKGYGGWINSFLSWKAFIPLGRLTFCVYVTGLRAQMFQQFRLRQPIRYDEFSGATLYLSHIVMAFMVGFVVSMAAEAPFLQLEKILLQERAAPKNEFPVRPSGSIVDEAYNAYYGTPIPRVVAKL